MAKRKELSTKDRLALGGVALVFTGIAGMEYILYNQQTEETPAFQDYVITGGTPTFREHLESIEVKAGRQLFDFKMR